MQDPKKKMDEIYECEVVGETKIEYDNVLQKYLILCPCCSGIGEHRISKKSADYSYLCDGCHGTGYFFFNYGVNIKNIDTTEKESFSGQKVKELTSFIDFLHRNFCSLSHPTQCNYYETVWDFKRIRYMKNMWFQRGVEILEHGNNLKLSDVELTKINNIFKECREIGN